MKRTRPCMTLVLSLGLGLLFVAPAWAQFSGNGQQPVMPQQMFPGTVVPNPSQLSPQQLQSMMLMRAMQNGGRHQVRTGIPQNIPLGNIGMMGGGAPLQMPVDTKPAATAKKSTSKKKLDAQAAREEKKRAAKEAAKAKKEKAAKKSKDKNADDQAAS